MSQSPEAAGAPAAGLRARFSDWPPAIAVPRRQPAATQDSEPAYAADGKEFALSWKSPHEAAPAGMRRASGDVRRMTASRAPCPWGARGPRSSRARRRDQGGNTHRAACCADSSARSCAVCSRSASSDQAPLSVRGVRARLKSGNPSDEASDPFVNKRPGIH